MRKVLALMLALLLACAFTAASAEEAQSGWENILLLGGDARNMDKYDRTDSIIILSVNRDESLVKMTSVMRDTWVAIPGHGNAKINACNVYGGPELMLETLNNNFGTNIESYVMINMEDMVQIVDLMGGVEVEVSESERRQINSYVDSYFMTVKGASFYDGTTFLDETGIIRLNGLHAMCYCRDRYSDSDFNRVMRQQEVLLALAENAQNMEVDELMDIAGTISDIVATNMDKEELKSLATAFMVMEIEDVEQYRIPADGTYKSGTFGGTWMIRPDLAANQALLKQFIYGE